MDIEVEIELMWRSTEMPGFPLEEGMGDIDDHPDEQVRLEKVGSGDGYGGQGFGMFLIQLGAGVSTSLVARYIYDRVVENTSEDPTRL